MSPATLFSSAAYYAEPPPPPPHRAYVLGLEKSMLCYILLVFKHLTLSNVIVRFWYVILSCSNVPYIGVAGVYYCCDVILPPPPSSCYCVLFLFSLPLLLQPIPLMQGRCISFTAKSHTVYTYVYMIRFLLLF